MDHVSAPDVPGGMMVDVASDDFTNDDRELINSEREFSPLEVSESQQRTDKNIQEGLRVIVISCIVFALSVTVALILTIYLGPDPVTPHGAISSISKECSNIGMDILKKGGSSVDAAIATTVCCAVVEPQLAGIGGGGFMMVRDQRNNKTKVVDFREVAPSSARADMFDSDPDNKLGGLRVGVPGLLKGLAEAHSKFGKLKWRDLISPAAQLAKDGFSVSKLLAKSIKEKIPNASHPLAKVFYQEGNPLGENDTLKMGQLAELLQNVSEHGAVVFYKGEYADEVVQTVNENGGGLSAGDLASYKVKHREPIATSFGEHVVEVPLAPSGGPILLLLLNLMESVLSEKYSNTTDLFHMQHQWLEAVKLAYGQIPTQGDTEIADLTIISKTFASELMNKTRSDSPLPAAVYGDPGPAETGVSTTVSVIGQDDEMVSVTISLGDVFGSQLVTPSMVILNNALADFSQQGQQTKQINLPGPQKRPFTSMTPAIIHTPGRVCATRLALGGGVNSVSIANTAEVLVNLLWMKKNLIDAVEAPRFFASVNPNNVTYDKTVNEDLLKYLTNLGHPAPVKEEALGFIDLAMKVNDNVTAYTDSRLMNEDNAVVF